MIAIASDHAALDMKELIKIHLQHRGETLRDFGTCSTERVDYCDFGFRLGEAVAAGEFERGIVLCGTGVGISISANKVRGIRAVVCSEPYSAKLSREHHIEVTRSGLVTVAGGKWTTYRRMAEDTLDAAIERAKRNDKVTSEDIRRYRISFNSPYYG